MKKLKTIIGSMTARFAALALALVCVGSVWGAETTTIQNAAGKDITVYVVAEGFYQSDATYTAATDFYITNLNGLKFFRDLVNGDAVACAGYPELPANRTIHAFSGKTVHLIADIDLGNELWEPIGYAYQTNERLQFEGSFDGGIYDAEGNLTGTHTIANLNVAISSGKYYAGLFGVYYASQNSTLKNLTLNGVNITSGQSAQGVGAFVGSAKGAQNGVTLENLHVIGSVNIVGSTSYVGGIVGDGRCTIKNCSVVADGTIKGTYNVGGISGGILTRSTGMYNCAVADVTVQATAYNYGLGALAGFSSALTVSNCTVSAVTVKCDASSYAGSGMVGLLVGFANSTSAYTILSDNTVINATATEYQTPITTQIGACNADYSIVGSNITFDESGKVTGGIFENIPTSAIAAGYITADNPNTETNESYPLTIGGPYVAVIYDSDTGKFKQGFGTLAAALSGAADGETITLISGPDKAISAQGEVTGGKTVTITGTAKFDWAPGWLFVGRGTNAGDGTLIFKDATITRSSDQASFGLHISGKNKSSATTNYGTLIITNSTIECDVLLNKGSITVYGKAPSVDVPDFEVFRGWGVGGRPASESVSGEHETATFTATDGAYIRLANHNGQGNGYEGNAVMSILNGSKFEYTGASFANGDNCTDGATGVINVDATSLLKMKAFQNLDNGNSFVVIDATGAAGSSKVIDLSGTKSLEGYVTVKNLVAPMTAIYDADGDVTLMSVAAIVNDSSDVLVGRYETLAEAVEAYQNGYTIVVFDKTQTIPEGWMFKESGNVTTLVKAVAQIGTTKYETVEAALTDAQTSGATIEILADSIETPDHALEVLMGGNITLTSTTPVRVEIAPTAKTSSVDTDGMAYIRSASADVRCTFTVGENVTLAFPATAAAAGAMYIGYSAANAADMVINGRLELYEPYVGSLSTLTVNPSGSIKSISECLIVRWGAKVDIIGTGAAWSDANPQAEFAYVSLQGGVTTLKDTYAKGGAWVQTWNRNADKVGQYGDTTLALDNSVLATSKVDNQVVIAMDCDSQIVTPVVQNTGSINIDATGITAPFKAIDYTGSGTMALANYGTVNVTGGEAYVEESDLWVKKLPVAQIGTTKYETIAAAVAAASTGDTIQLIADADEDVSLATWKNNAITFDLGGHTLTGQIIAPYGAKTDGIVIKNGNIVGRDSSSFCCLQFGYGSGNATLENLSVTQTSKNNRSYAVHIQQTDKRVTMRNVTLDGRFYTTNSGSTIAIESGVYKNSTGLSNADISNGGVVAAIGGTFYYNPTTPNNLVAKGYVATETTDADDVQCWVVELGPAFAKVTLKDGTETEFWDLDEAIGALAEGATLTIKPDTYTLASANYTLPKDVKIIGVEENGARVKITSCPTFNSANGLTIENVDFDGGYSWQPSAVTVHGDATFKNCTITCKQNAVYYSTINGTLTFDGCTITAGVYALNIGEGTGDVIVKDCTITGWTSFGNVGKTIVTGTTFEEGNYNYLRFYQDAVIDDCSFNNDMLININTTGKKLIVSDSAFENGSSVASAIGQGEEDDPPADNYIAVGTRITTDEDGFVTGGVFDKIDDGIIADGYISVDNLDGETMENYPLTVGGPYEAIVLDENGALKQGYATLAAAIAAVQDGETVQLIADVELSATVEIPAEKNVVLDMNGKTVTATGFANKVNPIVNKGTLSIANGTIVVAETDAKVYAILNDGGSLSASDLIINSSSGGIRVQGGTGTIEDCTITVNTTANTTAHGVYASDGANVTINSGTYSYTGPINQDTVQACDDGTVLTIEGGTFTAALDSVSTPNATPKVLHNNGSGAVVYVKGGSFTGDLGADAVMYVSGGTFNITKPYTSAIKISGGVFNFEVTDAMCAVGYSPAANTDAETKDAYPYTVAALYEAHIVRNGEVIAGSGGALAAVVAVAESGDTIQLLKDVALITPISAFNKTSAYSLAITKSLTIDGQGLYKITSSATRGIGVGGDGSKIDVTFKDIVVETSYNNSNGNIIETRGNIGTLTLDHATLTHSADLWWCGAVQIGGSQADKANVIIKDSTIDPGREGYPIVTWNAVNLEVTGSTLTGYCATYMKGIGGSAGSGGSIVSISNSVITVTNTTSDPSYSFGVFVFEKQGGGNDNTTINLVDSTVTLNATTGGNEYILYLNNGVTDGMSGNTVNIVQGDKIWGNGYTYLKNGGVLNLTTGVLVGGDEAGFANITNSVFTSYGYIASEEGVVVGDRTYYPLELPPVAQIVETGVKYENLMEAIEAAYNGGTVELLADVTVNRWHQNVWSVEDRDDLTYSGNRAVTGCNGLTINGNGHSLTINSIDSGSNGNQIFYGSRNLTVLNITINAASGVNGIGLKSGLISDVTFNMVGSNPAIYTGGSAGCEEGEHIEIRNCTFNTEAADSYAIYSCDPKNGVDVGTVISGNTFNTRRSVALRSDMQFLNNKVNGDKGVTVAGGSTAVVRGNYFSATTTSRSINVYPSNAMIENNVILGPIELENETYETEPDLSGNYWGGDYPANLPEGVVVNSYYTTYSGYDSPAQDGSLFSLSDPVVFVAKIVETDAKFEALADAIAAAQDGETIQLIADCETGSQYTIGNPLVLRAKNATLDLNGKTITATGNFSFLISGNNAIVKNGTIQAGANTAKNTGINSYAIVVNGCDGVKLSGLTVNGGVSVGGSTGDTPNAASATNVVIEDCTVTSGDYYAVCAQQNSTVTIASGSYTANTASSNSGTLYASFVGTDGPKGTIYVTGGMFAGKIPSGNKAGDIVISGGVYSVAPDAKFCAVGYEVVDNTDGETSTSYPKTVAHKAGYIVKNDNGEGYAVIPAVDEDWIAKNVEKAGETATTEEIEAALNAPDSATGLKKWEAYVLNQTTPIKVTAVAENGGALTTTLAAAKTGTGLDVTYSLVKMQGGVTNDTPCDKDDFAVDLADGQPVTGLYRIRVHFKPTGDASASEVTVDSVNTVGVLKVEPTVSRSIVAVPWKSLATDGDITVADFIRRADLSAADKLHVYNGSSYDTWTYSGSNWSAVKTFIAGKEGTDTTVSGSAEATTIAPGTGVWLERAGGTAPLYLVGEYSEQVETTLAAGAGAASPSWNLVGSPSVEAIDLNAAFGAPANAADRIVVPMPNGLQRNYTYKNGKWGYSDARKLANGRVQTFHNTENSVLPAGTGFWYLNAGDAQTIQW